MFWEREGVQYPISKGVGLELKEVRGLGDVLKREGMMDGREVREGNEDRSKGV